MLELNNLYNMDCMEGMKKIESGTVSMVLSDWPYGMTECEWDIPLDAPAVWKEYKRITKPNAAIVLMSKQPFTTDLIMSNRDWYRYSLVWLKNISTGFYNSRVMPLQAHEDICVFYQRKPTYNPQMETGFERKVSKASSKRKCKAAEIYNKAICVTDYDSTERYPISVLYFESDKHTSSLHPTQKPIALFEYLIRTFSDIGDTVLDNCAGSGTAAIAAYNTERNFICFEKDKDIFGTAQERLQTHMSQVKMIGA